MGKIFMNQIISHWSFWGETNNNIYAINWLYAGILDMCICRRLRKTCLSSALPESEPDPCWHLEGEILGSLDSGTSHVRILWPVKLIHGRRDYVWHFFKKRPQHTGIWAVCAQCTSRYTLRRPRKCFPPKKFPSQVWQCTGYLLPQWTQHSSPL